MEDLAILTRKQENVKKFSEDLEYKVREFGLEVNEENTKYLEIKGSEDPIKTTLKISITSGKRYNFNID